MKVTTKQVYDVQPLIDRLKVVGYAFVEAGKTELGEVINTLADAGVVVEHEVDHPIKQGYHFLRYVPPAPPAVKTKAPGKAKAKKSPSGGGVKTYTASKNGDVFTGTLSDCAEHFSVKRITLYKAVQKSEGLQTAAAGVSIVEFGKSVTPQIDQEL